MWKAFVLVRNLRVTGPNDVEEEKPRPINRLDFGEFTISAVGLRYKELRKVFACEDVYQTDWIFEKTYQELPPGPIGSAGNVGGIPNEIEDILLLCRLYKAGDIGFVKQAITLPTGETLNQYPYRAMNSLNSYSVIPFEFKQEECAAWIEFSAGIRRSQSWDADWFRVARRFFLYGGAKEFNPQWDDVDRIVDYATALESTLVPEKDFNTRRISRRAGKLIAPGDGHEEDAITNLVKKFYGMRSGIVHGGKLSNKDREWLMQNCGDIEHRVRQVLVAAVEVLPPDEAGHKRALSAIYDPTDDDRGEQAFAKFQEIKTPEVERRIADKIAIEFET